MKMTIERQYHSYCMLARCLRRLAGSYASLVAEDPQIPVLGCDLVFDFSEDLLLHRNALKESSPPFSPAELLSDIDYLIELIVRIERDSDSSAMSHAAFDTHPRWLAIRRFSSDILTKFTINENVTLADFKAGTR